jgi:hypothetical protein
VANVENLPKENNLCGIFVGIFYRRICSLWYYKKMEHKYKITIVVIDIKKIINGEIKNAGNSGKICNM